MRQTCVGNRRRVLFDMVNYLLTLRALFTHGSRAISLTNISFLLTTLTQNVVFPKKQKSKGRQSALREHNEISMRNYGSEVFLDFQVRVVKPSCPKVHA